MDGGGHQLGGDASKGHFWHQQQWRWQPSERKQVRGQVTGATCSSRAPVLSICAIITEESQTLGDQLMGELEQPQSALG